MQKFTLTVLTCSLLALAACNNNNGKRDGSSDTLANKPVPVDSGSNPRLELVFQDSTYQITGIAMKDGGQLIINYPRWSDIYRYAATQATGMATSKPYPDEAMNSWQPGTDGKDKWVCVQSSYYDDNGTLWILDPAAPKLKNVQDNGAKLVKMDMSNNKPQRTYSFMSIISDTSYVNDLRIDTKKQYAYLTNSKEGGIIIVDLNTGKMRQVLKGHSSTISDPAYKLIMDGHELMKDGKPAKFNSDGIALTPDGDWIYYKPLSDDKLYRIKTDYLRDWNMDEAGIDSKVEDLGHFNTTDGMIFDKDGNLYMGDIQKNSIVRMDKNKKLTTIVQDNRLLWPDSYAIAGGYLYVSCSQIHKQPEYNNGVNKRTTPFAVYRIKI